MRIQDVMSDPVKSIDPKLPATEALRTMRQERIHHLVVTSSKGLVGVLSAHDLERGPDGLRGKSVADLMHPDRVTADPGMYVRDAANLLRGRSIGCLPVLEDGKLVGMVTLSDLLEVVGRSGNGLKMGHSDHQPHRKVSRRPNRNVDQPL